MLDYDFTEGCGACLCVCVRVLMFTGTLGFSTFPASSAIRLAEGLVLIME